MIGYNIKFKNIIKTIYKKMKKSNILDKMFSCNKPVDNHHNTLSDIIVIF